MATNTEAQALGFTTPIGTDRIRDGDEAIARNARISTDLHRAALAAAAAAADDAAAASRAPVGAARATFLELSRNLYNPNDPDADTDVLISSATGAAVPLAGYMVTGFITVTAGQPYTLTGARNVAFYDQSKTWLGAGAAGFVDNPPQTPLTVTPTEGGYLRASFHAPSYESTFQVEKGTTPTGYTPYRVTVQALALPTVGGMRVDRDGSALSIVTDLDGLPLTQACDLAGSANGGFNWTTTRLNGTLRHACSDSITPLRTSMGTIGGNHGFSNVRSFANPDAKTTADVGSTWTDGTTTYTLLKVETSGRLILAGPPASGGPGGTPTSANVAPVADLTHVSGATQTATIAASSIAAAQLYPSVGRLTVEATLDGAPLTDGAESQGSVLRISETYEILDYADLIAQAQANVGTPYTALPVAGAIRMSTLYEMRAPGTWTISTAVTALAPQFLFTCGFIQSEALSTPAGGSVWRWLPGVAPIGGLDWHAGVNLAAHTTNQWVYPADLLDATKPPTWMTEWARDSAGETVLGFAHGYFPDKSDGSWSARVASSASHYWDLRSSKKSYPEAFTSKALAAGERVSVQAWRAYLPASSPRALAVPDAQAAYAFAQATAATAQPMPMPTQLGRTITPLAEQGITIAPGVVDADGITVTGTGAAVAKLT